MECTHFTQNARACRGGQKRKKAGHRSDSGKRKKRRIIVHDSTNDDSKLLESSGHCHPEPSQNPRGKFSSTTVCAVKQGMLPGGFGADDGDVDDFVPTEVQPGGPKKVVTPDKSRVVQSKFKPSCGGPTICTPTKPPSLSAVNGKNSSSSSSSSSSLTTKSPSLVSRKKIFPVSRNNPSNGVGFSDEAGSGELKVHRSIGRSALQQKYGLTNDENPVSGINISNNHHNNNNNNKSNNHQNKNGRSNSENNINVINDNKATITRGKPTLNAIRPPSKPVLIFSSQQVSSAQVRGPVFNFTTCYASLLLWTAIGQLVVVAPIKSSRDLSGRKI